MAAVVVRDQIWSLMDASRPRYWLRVVRVEGLVVHGVLEGGTPYRVSLSVLRHGRRGARLEAYPDGTLAEHPKYDAGYTPTVEETKTASDYVRVVKPKGMARASERDREALRLREEEGVKVREIAARLGITMLSAAGAMRRARLARQDERYLGRTG
jgi:Sigma-70, region 4